MPLVDRQREFVAALFDESTVAGLPAGALDIYRNNLRAGFRKALALEFPVIERLVGAEFFRTLARDYQNVRPSRSGDVHRIGVDFPAYLRKRYFATPHAYFADVAALEWSCVESLAAADTKGFDPESLPALIAYAEHLCATFHASVRLTRTGCPALAIWRAHIESSAPDLAHIDIDAGGESVMTWRTSSGVRLAALSEAEAAWLDSLIAGAKLGAAFDAAVRSAASDARFFDVAATLHRWIASGAIVQLKR